MTAKIKNMGLTRMLLLMVVVPVIMVLISSRQQFDTRDIDVFAVPSGRVPPSRKARESDTLGNIIAYAITVTQCSTSDKESAQMDQAAILLHSIHRQSSRMGVSKYDYHPYAFVHPSAQECAPKLKQIGWDVQVRENPVEKEDIEGPLKEFVREASCCGEKEFLKLYSYTLTQHLVAVHLDLDCLIVQPLDELYDSMIEGPESPARKQLALQWKSKKLPDNIEAFFTRDYNMVNDENMRTRQIGVQGGFLVVKPNNVTFQQYKNIIVRGNYTRDDGWGGEYGGYFGAAQIQGLCAYFFGAIKPKTAVELNRCVYNYMGDNPYFENTDTCKTTRKKKCEDCRLTPVENIKSVHFTTCTKPWWCQSSELDPNRENSFGKYRFPTCAALHHRWFQTRRFIEEQWSTQHEGYDVIEDSKPYSAEMTWKESTALGYCRKENGILAYIPMEIPATASSAQETVRVMDNEGTVLDGTPEAITNNQVDLKQGDQSMQKEEEEGPITIGYAVSVTQCVPAKVPADQAAVVLYSIHDHSVRNPNSGSKYDYHAYAFLHPDAADCKEILELVGWDVQVRDTPIKKENIRGRLKEFVHEASCCQEKEFLKLYAYVLDHPVVVHLDLDSLILQPLDHLFDSIIYDKSDPRGQEGRAALTVQWKDKPIPDKIEGFFTRDYNMLNAGIRQPHQTAVQGGFLVVKPDMEIFNHYLETILDGNYTRWDGWGGKLRYGGYYGAAQIQGLCAYFFGAVRPNRTVELNRCVYNYMSDNPRDTERGNKCRTLEDDCEDCRLLPIAKIKTVHFTLCGKPWWCQRPDWHNKRGIDIFTNHQPCLQAHHYWFRTRLLVERTWESKDPQYSMTEEARNFDPEWKNVSSFGFCRKETGYIKMPLPKQRIEFG